MYKFLTMFFAMILILSSCDNKKVNVVKTINEIENDTSITVSKNLELYNTFIVVKIGFFVEPFLESNEIVVKRFINNGISYNDKLIFLFENETRLVLYNYNKKQHIESKFKLNKIDILRLSRFSVKKIQYATDANTKYEIKQTIDVNDKYYFVNVYSDYLNKRFKIVKH